METLPVPAADIFEPFRSEIGHSFTHIHNACPLLHTDRNTDTVILESVGTGLETQEHFLDEDQEEEEDDNEEEEEKEESEFTQERLGSSIDSTDFTVSEETNPKTSIPSEHNHHHHAFENDETLATFALLTPDTDITPTLPIVEVVFEGTLHELFVASSEAFKSSRPVSFTRGALLFSNNESLLEEPLSILFERLREDLLLARFGEDAVHYGMSMVFKSLDDLWLSEHESSASSCSLAKLVRLYTASSGLQGQEILLEPFRIELSVQETFLSHMNRLENETKAQSSVAITEAVVSSEEIGTDVPLDAEAYKDTEAEAEAEAITDTLLNEDGQEDIEETHILSAPQEHSISIQEGKDTTHSGDHSTSKTIVQDSISVETEISADIISDVHEITENKQADDNELIHDDEPYYITEIDVDSLACFDDKAYDNEDSNPEDELHSLQMEIATVGSNSPVTRSRKRSVEELIDLLDDEFVNELSPDRELYKKTKTDV
ncbi:hypothetical protein BGZ46_008396 [Entomortierella lignicola]|nr:hypothetical protein BGZ46_008396 [Entomortierella lignicola]